MSYIEVNGLKKTFTVKKKREKGKLFREKQIVEALKGISFSVEKGELTNTLKIKRRVLNENYKKEIDAMYAE